jgi:hypothetical protein
MSPSSARFESQTPYSRLSRLCSGVLDGFSFALFYLSFSSLTHVLHAIWYRLVTEDRLAIPGEETDTSQGGTFLTSANRSCYNQQGGGNSSTGRAPDCGSDGCGFDSRFPPQKSPL